jgi:flagellar basal-body rod modification protein FlgD
MTTVSTNQVSQSLLDQVNAKTSSTSATDATQDRFLTLLISQMKNQDPLNPMDNAQVTSQMAQLSTVTGINTLNETVKSLIDSVQLGQSYQATDMIGHAVLVKGNTVTTDETGGYFGVNLPNGADSLTVTIKNGAGQTVRTLNLGEQSSGNSVLQWDGKDDDGVAASSGSYTFDVSATLNATTTTSTALSAYEVKSISSSTTGVKLNLSDNSSVSTSDIYEVY